MSECSKNPVYSTDYPSVQQGEKDGFQEQIVLLSRLSEQLDIYFSL
jgi:hypothetical protein